MEKDRVIFLGAHPDDFIGSAGTALRMRGLFDLHIWDFTHGERGLIRKGVSMQDCARIRTLEESSVAEKIGAELFFF